MLQGLEFLSRSIDQKSASLKVLVESNFERFVRAKTTIDNVYAEMRNQGVEPEKPKTHARIPSKSSAHYRSSSGQGALSPNKGIHKPLPSDKKKNALTKDSEYGVQGIRAPLIEVAAKAEELWGPALGGRDKEGMLKMAVESLEKNRGIFETSTALADSIKRKDYEKLVENYRQARKYADEARDVANTATEGQIPLTDAQIHQMVITARMWEEVEKRVDNFKRIVWRKLTDSTPSSMAAMGGSQYEEYTALIAILLELGVEDNPIWLWLLSRWEYLKNKINASFERSRVQIEVLRRHLANSEAPILKTIASHLRPSTRQSLAEKAKDLDTAPVLELWELVFSSIHNLLSSQSGILGEVIEFWDRAQKFIDGKVQKTLPVGFDGRSRIHHRLSTESIRQLQDGIFGLVDLLREHIFSLFAEPPIEDISMLYSPLPPQTPNTPKSATRSPFGFHDSRFIFDSNNLPPPSPRRGEAWEEFAFWPPHANSLSGTYYLGKMLALIGAAASEMLGIRQVASGGVNLLEKLRTLISGVRERSIRAVCIAWNRDAEACKVLEDWKRSPERRDLTAMPGHYSSFETAVLSGLQKILYIPEAGTTRPPGSTGVVPPPPAKLLLVVRSQFVTTLYNAISGMVENAERPVSNSNPGWVMTGSEFDYDFTAATNEAEGALDVRNRVCLIFFAFTNLTAYNVFTNVITSLQSIRMLLTLSNLKALQSEIVPHLISQFETSFSVKLTDESSSIRADLAQIEAKLFSSYTSPTTEALSLLIHSGVQQHHNSTTSRPQNIRPFVHKALLTLVHIHTQVISTSPPLTTPILTHLFESLSLSFLSAFRTHPPFSLPSLMQSILDIEFVAQVMSQYTTERAINIQDQIHAELDKVVSGEGVGLREKSREELVEVGGVIKRLREGMRVEFGCFRVLGR